MENLNLDTEIEDYKFVRRFGNDLKDVSQRLKSARASLTGLGEINWQAIEDYENDRLKRLYITPKPVIPYPHGNKKVTALGFDRIEESLP